VAYPRPGRSPLGTQALPVSGYLIDHTGYSPSEHTRSRTPAQPAAVEATIAITPSISAQRPPLPLTREASQHRPDQVPQRSSFLHLSYCARGQGREWPRTNVARDGRERIDYRKPARPFTSVERQPEPFTAPRRSRAAHDEPRDGHSRPYQRRSRACKLANGALGTSSPVVPETHDSPDQQTSRDARASHAGHRLPPAPRLGTRTTTGRVR
jgi:hypothetical protein